jgi:hypothetical protein
MNVALEKAPPTRLSLSLLFSHFNKTRSAMGVYDVIYMMHNETGREF